MDVEVGYDRKNNVEQMPSDKVTLIKYKASVSISMESDFNYELQDLLKLPRGEYICRLIDGYEHSMHINTFNEYESLLFSKTRQAKKM